MICPLCTSKKSSLFHKGENREYLHCQVCDLVYIPQEFFLSKEQEKAKYDNHQNSIKDEGYCNFLDRLLTPLQRYLKPNAKGLDFGSGPGPTLSMMMKQRGFEMDIYDIFYAKNSEVFAKKYDFITSTEVIEHLYDPLFDIKRLWSMVNAGGVLGLMTAFRVEDFANWYYKRDLTHIRFYSPLTFKWLANELKAKLILPESGVIILKKS